MGRGEGGVMFAWVLLCCLEGTASVQVSCFRGREKMGGGLKVERGQVEKRKRG